jgi:class 3 adenylate cyclase
MKAGGIMAGWEGDTALIAFGSPLERMVLEIRGEASYDKGKLNPAAQAIQFLNELLAGFPGKVSWYFGIDVGKCAFVPIPGSGYRVYGSPAACSRLLSKFAPRYKVPTLVTKAVREQVQSIPVRAVRITDHKGSRTFYTLLIRGTP